jgi:hypothetical protein
MRTLPDWNQVMILGMNVPYWILDWTITKINNLDKQKKVLAKKDLHPKEMYFKYSHFSI